MTVDEWVEAAIVDDCKVAELLLRLHNPTTAALLHPPSGWSVRQRRSKPVTVQPKKPAQRDSPTTPLSWSGGATSTSAGCGGAAVDNSPEESSQPIRSKGKGTTETTKKRSRKKKTLAELKEEEMSLVKERRQLKRELASMRANLEIQRAANKSLKRMKLVEMQLQPGGKTAKSEAISSDLQQEITSCDPPIQAKQATKRALLEHSSDGESKFVIPDLNIIPVEVDSSYEVPCGVS